MAELLEELAFMMALKEMGYQDPRPLGDGRYAALYPFMFTWAIITGQIGDLTSYDDRWCYHTHDAAQTALNGWNGNGEPEGWHRHPASGRRRVDGDPSTEIIAR